MAAVIYGTPSETIKEGGGNKNKGEGQSKLDSQHSRSTTTYSVSSSSSSSSAGSCCSPVPPSHSDHEQSLEDDSRSENVLEDHIDWLVQTSAKTLKGEERTKASS